MNISVPGAATARRLSWRWIKEAVDVAAKLVGVLVFISPLLFWTWGFVWGVVMTRAEAAGRDFVLRIAGPAIEENTAAIQGLRDDIDQLLKATREEAVQSEGEAAGQRRIECMIAVIASGDASQEAIDRCQQIR